MPPRGKRFSIFDALEDAGVFQTNPANRDARGPEGESIYKKQEYPKMLYHPDGEEEVIVPATAEMTPFGPQMLGEQRALINIVVNTPEEEKKLLAQGWHDHPAKAIAAAKDPKRPIPPVSSETRAQELQAQVVVLEAELEKAKSANLAGARAEAAVKGTGVKSGLA